MADDVLTALTWLDLPAEPVPVVILADVDCYHAGVAQLPAMYGASVETPSSGGNTVPAGSLVFRARDGEGFYLGVAPSAEPAPKRSEARRDLEARKSKEPDADPEKDKALLEAFSAAGASAMKEP